MPNFVIAYGSLLIAIICETIATSFLKTSEQFTQVIPSIITSIGYICSFYFLSITLKYIPVGIAYAIWSGLGIFLVSTISFFVFKQKLDIPACIGLGMIALGVVVIQVLSKSVTN